MNLIEKYSYNIKLIILIFSIILTGSCEHILIPLIAMSFESLYFVLIVTSIQGFLNYFCILIIVYLSCKNQNKIRWNSKTILTILLSGFLNALMSIAFLYSANPTRTPIIIQSIFLGLVVFPTVIFRKLLLKKEITYNIYYIIPSIVLLLMSVVIASLPLYNEINLNNAYWIFGYLAGILLLSLDGVMQERYIVITKDESILNKLFLATSVSFVQIFSLLSLFWIEYLIGYSDKPFESLLNCLRIYFSSIQNVLFLQFFI